MKKTNSMIEVNGNLYDASTGQMLAQSKRPRKKMVDGFVLGSHHAGHHLKKTVKATRPKARAKVASQNLHKSAQRSKTLMRQAVKKPASLKQTPSEVSHKTIDHIKMMRAKTAVKHDKVERFGHFAPSKPKVKSVPSEVVHAGKTVEPTTLRPRMPSMITSASHKKLDKMLDEALYKAEAHRLMMNQRTKNRNLSSISWGVAVVFVGVVLALLIWQHLPTLASHIALSVNP